MKVNVFFLVVTIALSTTVVNSPNVLADSIDSKSKKKQQPNIILILTDDQGYGDLSIHKHPILKTPNLDRFASESVRFDNCYVSPSCSPTRAALLTGIHEFRNGVTHTVEPRQKLNLDATILPEILREGGYRTGHIGKWHLGTGKEYLPSNRGFEWTSYNRHGPNSHFDPVIVRNGVSQKLTGFREDKFFDEAMTFIVEDRSKPFFCYLSTYSPHTPLAAPEKFVAKYRGFVNDKHATYLAMVSNIDYNVGRLMQFLKAQKLDENTIVIFMNDNGQTEGLDVYNAGMRGCKSTIWEGGSRAISFWRFPNQWKPKIDNHLTAHLDVVPTLLDLANIKPASDIQEKLEGYSLRPLLESETPIEWHEDRLLFHHVARWTNGMAAEHKYTMCGVRKRNFLLLRSTPCDHPSCKDVRCPCAALRLVRDGATKLTYTDSNAQFHWGLTPPTKWILIDTKKDPRCLLDISSQHGELVAELTNAYENWWNDLYPEIITATAGDSNLNVDLECNE